MTRKHFQMVADSIKGELDKHSLRSDNALAVVRVMKDLADKFKADNPSFQRSRFFSACGVQFTGSGVCVNK